MIVNLERFLAEEQLYWQELQTALDRLEREPESRPTLDAAKRLHYLYERAAADLAKVTRFAPEAEIRRYLETLVARAYAEIHEVRRMQRRFPPLAWLFGTFPQTFRRHINAFYLAAAITGLGCLIGALILILDPGAKQVLMPFAHLQMSPSERVQMEEEQAPDRHDGGKAGFASFLMTHNIRVSIFTFSLGVFWGLGTLFMLFYNGVLLGAVCADFVVAGEGAFVAGWLLPHGSIEIPAILLAGQAGLVLAGALIGRNSRRRWSTRLRDTGGDLVTLLGGLALLLVWAGVVEAFLSQYHEPILPYAVKIAFGGVELLLLFLFLALAGRKTVDASPQRH